MTRITWRETRQRLREDRLRLRQFFDISHRYQPWLMLLSVNYQCVFLHRISFFLFHKGFRVWARFFWHLNLLLTGADISPISDIGGGLVIELPMGCNVAAKVGRNCLFRGHCSIGGGMSDKSDIGAGPGLPVVGNGVELGFRVILLGPITIGDRVRIGSGCMVLHDIGEDSVLEPPEPLYSVLKKTAE